MTASIAVDCSGATTAGLSETIWSDYSRARSQTGSIVQATGLLCWVVAIEPWQLFATTLFGDAGSRQAAPMKRDALLHG